jgi:uncharacterized protein (DUF2062 family)
MKPPGYRSRFTQWIVAPLNAELMRGAAPDKLAWTIAVGVVLGIFPIMGSTTLLCILVSFFLRLNQIVVQVFKSLVYPLHLALILVFIRLGEKLNGAPMITLSVPQLVARFKENPMNFAREFGLAAWHGITAWALIAPLLAVLIKLAVLPALSAWRARLNASRELAS